MNNNTFNPDDLKFLERENFEGFIKIVETVGLPIYLNEVRSSDFSRIYATLEAIRKLGKAAAGRFEIIVRSKSPSISRPDGVPVLSNDNIHIWTGDGEMRKYMAQIASDFPEISYYLTFRSQQILPQFFTKVRKRSFEYWPADACGNEYRAIEDRFYKAAWQYHRSLES